MRICHAMSWTASPMLVDQCKGIGLSNAKVLVIGAAYKKDVDDMRESPALVIIELLKARRTIVDYYDPYVPGNSKDARTFRSRRHAINLHRPANRCLL